MSAATEAGPVRAPPLGLYVHLPWCVRKCPYCDFNSHRAPTELPTEAYVEALVRDFEQQAPSVRGRTIETVFFGGGTPSLFPPEAFARFLEAVGRSASLAADAEITMEVNPGTVERSPFDAYRVAGITRVSLGVQSFDDESLKRIGRIHGGAEAERVVAEALRADFESVNVDLMFALPEQSLGGAVADVERALALGAPHVSHYQLTIEPNTLFHARPPVLPDDEAAWAMQDACHAALASAGYEHYEVSAWAKPGHQCRHNMNYWRFGDYLGVGAGAHGKLSDPRGGIIRRTLRQRHPRTYLENPLAFQTQRQVAADERLFEFALNAFRLRDGVSIHTFETTTDLVFDPLRDPWLAAIDRGLLEIHADRVRPSERGFTYLNDLQALFLSEETAHD